MLSETEAQGLLEQLCVDLGFCLPDQARARISARPVSDAESFARVVFDAEGIDADLPSSRRLFQQVLAVVSNAYDEAVRVRLMWAVQTLAQPARLQLEMFPAFVVAADELALNLEDARMLAQDRGVLNEALHRALQPLEEKLTAMSASGDEYAASLWTREALQERDEWAEVRTLARNACGACGWSTECPPLDPRQRGLHYVRGN